MFVFIDESGDAGLDVASGASPVFVAAMAIFDDDAAAADLQRVIAASEARRLHKPEFKFSKCSDVVRDAFFDAVSDRAFAVRAIVVRKELVPAFINTRGQEQFYRFFVEALLRRNEALLVDARIVIDGSGASAFRKSVNSAVRQRMRPGAVKSVRFKDSKGDVLVQLADICAGAIARTYRVGRGRRDRWLTTLRPRIGEIWEYP